MNIDASPNSWHSPPLASGLESPSAVVVAVRDICAELAEEVRKTGATVTLGSDDRCSVIVTKSFSRRGRESKIKGQWLVAKQ